MLTEVFLSFLFCDSEPCFFSDLLDFAVLTTFSSFALGSSFISSSAVSSFSSDSFSSFTFSFGSFSSVELSSDNSLSSFAPSTSSFSVDVSSCCSFWFSFKSSSISVCSNSAGSSSILFSGISSLISCNVSGSGSFTDSICMSLISGKSFIWISGICISGICMSGISWVGIFISVSTSIFSREFTICTSGIWLISAIFISIFISWIFDIPVIAVDKLAISISSVECISITPLDRVSTIDVASKLPTWLISAISVCWAITKSARVNVRLKSSIIEPNRPIPSPLSAPKTLTEIDVLSILKSCSRLIVNDDVIIPSL